MDDTTSSVEQLRLQLLENGYSPIRNRDKRTFMTGWPSVEITPDEIRSWSRRNSRDKATGLRIENGLAVIDIDIDDKGIVDAAADAILDLCPQLEDANVPLLVRRGSGAKEAWFIRTDEAFGRIHSRAWRRRGEGVDATAHRVEVFGGASPRQFGAFGPHTVLDDGTVAKWYSWAEASPAEVRQPELPVIPKATIFLIVDAIERILEEAGWEVVPRSEKGENREHRVYDLTPDMAFDCDDGVTRTLDELRDVADSGIRCSASWLEGPTAINRSRCLVTETRAGHVAIWETASGTTHVEEAAKPRDYTLDLDRVAERLKELDQRRRHRITSGDDAITAAAKLLETRAFCPRQQQAIVPVWADDVDEGITLSAFRTEMLPNRTEEQGPRGGRVVINPVDIWAGDARRLTVEGIRMRPDKPRPIFEELGRRYVNCYNPPVHDEPGGDARLGVEFLAHLLPEERELRWFVQWLAFKLRNPYIPGPAVVMVARAFGTGRGTLGKLCALLFGPRYVRSLPFQMFTGKTYQSQYNEWLASALLVFVNESAEVTDGSAYRTKSNTYEHLKELVEPRPIEREIMVKGRANYRAVSSTSFLIATNHEDALPIPADDRRFAVLTNGGPRDVDYWRELNDWMDRPENVAAFAQWLHEVDLTGYSPFEKPPVFAGQQAMVEASKSDLDLALDYAIENLQGPLATMEQVVGMMAQMKRMYDLDLHGEGWKATAKRKLIPRRMFRVGIRNGRNWVLKDGGKRYAVYATSAAHAARATSLDTSELHAETLRNGSLEGPGSGVGNVIAMPRQG